MSDIKKGLAGVVVDTTVRLEGQPRDQLAALPRLPGAGARREVLVRGGRLPALVRRAADRRAAARRSSSSSGRTARSTTDVKRVIDELPLDRAPDGCRAHRRQRPRARATPRPPTCAATRTSTSRKRLFAQLPAIVAYDQRRRRGRTSSSPRDDLGYTRELPAHDLRRGARPGRRRARSTCR